MAEVTKLDAKRPMRIGVVGGLRHSESTLTRVAAEDGFTLELHQGHVAGRGADTIRALVARCDLVVIVTEINSHGAVHLVKDAAREVSVPTVIVRKFSVSRLRELMQTARAA